MFLQDRERHGQGETGNRSRGWPGPCRDRAHMDVFTASPEETYRATLATLTKHQSVSKRGFRPAIEQEKRDPVPCLAGSRIPQVDGSNCCWFSFPGSDITKYVLSSH